MDFFGRTRHPYYIHAPDYRPTSAGIIAVYVLCHTLNELGYEAYITLSTTTSDILRAPLLTQKVMESHYKEGMIPISLSPETLNADPFDLPIKARWLLNHPGHLGGPETIPDDEILFHFDDWVLSDPLRLRSLKLRSPTFDTRIFTNQNNPDDLNRSGIAYYAHKYLVFGGVLPETTRDWTSLGQEIPRTKAEIASLLRRSEALVCFEQSSLIAEALACGCPVILASSDYWPEAAIGELANHPGIALLDQPNSLAKAKSTIAAYPAMLAEDHAYCLSTIKQFIGITQIAALKHQAGANIRVTEDTSRKQQLWNVSPDHRAAKLNELLATFGSYVLQSTVGNNVPPSPPPGLTELPSRAAQQWLGMRTFQPDKLPILANDLENWPTFPSFQIVIRLPEGNTAPLAKTMDSLNSQIYNRWHIDVVTTHPCPTELDSLTSLKWHTADSEAHKSLIDFVIAAGQHDWVIELPSGAILDPLCLWRICAESHRQEHISAFFVDDDVYDQTGIRFRPRLKPGVNPEWLQSSDLAGPLFIKRDLWRICGGASQDAPSAWFDQLIRIVATQGWQSLSHIPDVLVSYPERFPSATEYCLRALLSPHSPTSDCEIIPVTEKSWRIRYPLMASPLVSLAVISRGQLEFLQGCLESLAEHTNPAHIELLLIREQTNDYELESWLANYCFHGTPPRQVQLRNGANWAEACNAGVVSASHEHVVLLQEDTRVLDSNWLENLLRTLKPLGVSAVSPRLVRPATGLVAYAGDVLGLLDNNSSPYKDEAHFSEPGYLDCLQISRDVSLLAKGCMLVTKSDYIAAEGMEAEHFPEHLAHHDLSLKLLSAGNRLIYQPQTTLVHFGEALCSFSGASAPPPEEVQVESSHNLSKRWLRKGITDPYWNPNLSLIEKHPAPETDFFPAWQHLPVSLPRITARPVTNGQGDFRITSPLKAAVRAGLALDCIWPQSNQREFTSAELARQGSDSLIVQNYLVDIRLKGLAEWRRHGTETFIVYAIDDLCTEMPEASSLRSNVPANARSRLKFALSQCDRLVVSTEFLADAYSHFINDIRIVPNRLEYRLWESVHSQKQTGKKPRIGWSGGTTHQGDLSLLKDVISATSNEADWIFFGMCPEEIRPFIHEYHDFTPLSDYPAKLASLNLDIAVAPLEINRFNQAKSNLRLLDYGILGIPVVCTDITPYQGSPAKCVTNTTQAWIEALRERIADPAAAQAEGETLRQWVMRDYILENHHADWLAAHLP